MTTKSNKIDKRQDRFPLIFLAIISVLERYPFGKIKDIDSLNQRLSDLQAEIIHLDNWQSLIYSQDGNKLKFLKLINLDEDDPESVFIQIYNVNIISNSISLDHGIQVGMSKQALFKTMNIPDSYNFDDIKTIELISGLSGVWHYYIFTGKVLSNIIIKTDYYLP